MTVDCPSSVVNKALPRFHIKIIAIILPWYSIESRVHKQLRRPWRPRVIGNRLRTRTEMAPPGYAFDMELLANLYRDSGIVKIKLNNVRNKK